MILPDLPILVVLVLFIWTQQYDVGGRIPALHSRPNLHGFTVHNVVPAGNLWEKSVDDGGTDEAKNDGFMPVVGMI